MKKYYILNRLFFIILIFANLQIFAEYDDFAFEFFSGHQPSARAEAMGKGYVAVGGDIYSAFYNPAGISSIDGFMFNASYATPYYLLEDATYSFLGIAYKFNRYLVVSFDRYHFNYGVEFEEIGIEGPTGRIIKPYISNYKLTFCSEPFIDLHIGISTNLFLWNLGETFRAFCFDVGVIKKFSLYRNEYSEQKINLAGSLVNFSNSKLTEVVDLPITARIGFFYEFSFSKNLKSKSSKTLGFLFHVEYQDMLNYEYRTALRFGMELSFWEILFLRAGCYNESVSMVYKNRLSDFTYGFGIQFPFGRFSEKYKRLNIKIDFASMPQVSYVRYGKWDNFLNMGLLINYQF